VELELVAELRCGGGWAKNNQTKHPQHGSTVLGQRAPFCEAAAHKLACRVSQQISARAGAQKKGHCFWISSAITKLNLKH
jgi:hypothetical protein